jgi:hypothetical protein
MSQKSSLLQPANSVSQVLIPDTPDPIKSSFADPFEAARTSVIAFWFNIAFPLERAVVR